MDAKLFAHDGQEEGASARAETADGNGQAYAEVRSSVGNSSAG